MSERKPHKVFILGLDGATFSVLEPLEAAGAVPTLARLMRQGAVGPLHTIFPPVTAPAWLALATGLNPGKTGVFDYINRSQPYGTALQSVSSRHYQGRALWDILGKQGSTVGIFNYPTLSPAPEVNGFSVTGLGGYRSERLCWPPSLEKELQRLTGGYENFLNLRDQRYKKDIGRFFDDIERILAKHAKSLLHLVRTRSSDFFFAVLSVTDWMQHVLWKDLDPEHPLHDSLAAEGIRQRFQNVWRQIDVLIAEILEILPNDVNFIIVSDHGAGGLDAVFYPNVWLEQEGWLKRRGSCRSSLAGWFGLFAGGGDQKFARRFTTFLRHRVLRISSTVDLIDFDRSLAYSPEHNTMFGCINFTVQGRRRPGFAEELTEALMALPGKWPGLEQIEVLHPGKLYTGPYVDHAPDILFVVNGYRATVEIDLVREPFRSAPSLALRSGGHRPEGVFIASGPAFRGGWRGRPSVLDVAPTVLALYGVEIPASLDGRILEDALAVDVTKDLKVRYAETSGEESVGTAGTEDEVEEMKDTLRSLGYL